MTDKMTIKLLAIFICIPILILAFAGCNNKENQSSSDTEGTTAVSETQDTDNESGDPSEGEPSDGEPSGTDPSDTQNADDTKKTTTTKKTPTTTAPPPDLKGRTITYAANWNEPTNDARYMKRKQWLEGTLKCKIKHYPLLSDTDRDNLTNSILAGKPIADFFTQGPGVYNFASKGMLYPISDLECINVNDPKWNKLIREYSTINGKTYGIYWKQNVFRNVLVYNKSLIKGDDDLYTLQKNGKLTWDKLFAIAQKVQQANANVKDFAAVSGTMDINDFTNVFIAANNGRMATRGKGLDFSYAYDSKNTRRALEEVQRWVKAGLLLDVAGKSYLYAHSQFYKGKVGMMPADNWQLSDIFAKAKFKVGAVLFPKGPDAKYDLVDQNGQEFYMIPSTVKNPEEVGKFINAMADYDIANDPTWEEIWGDMCDDDKQVMDTFRRYLKAIDEGKYFLDYRDVVQGAIYDNGVYGMLAQVARSSLTPQAFLESIKPVAEQNIKELAGKS
jgi:ABC-type glycerol-3-phosphate transport system substrate-binding protein